MSNTKYVTILYSKHNGLSKTPLEPNIHLPLRILGNKQNVIVLRPYDRYLSQLLITIFAFNLTKLELTAYCTSSENLVAASPRARLTTTTYTSVYFKCSPCENNAGQESKARAAD